MNTRILMYLHRLAIRWARTIVDAADERVHAWEVGLRAASGDVDQAAAKSEALAEVDPKASRARERARKRTAKPRAPRLRYVHGEFVRQ
jgi:hypothetical protein